MRTPHWKNSAFSLLQLLAVIFIIGIIASFVVLPFSTTLRGSQLSLAEQILTDQIKLARQMAVTRNHHVEVRFIRYSDPEMPGEYRNDPSTGCFRAVQLLEILDNGATVPLDKPQMLPQAIIINAGNFSTLVSHPDLLPVRHATSGRPATDGTGGDPSMPRGIDWDYEFIAFRFLPDGSTSLNSAAGTIWHVTLHNINERVTGQTPPPNFVTLQLDPVTGTVRLFRPSV